MHFRNFEVILWEGVTMGKISTDMSRVRLSIR